jgi:hypothetical protein
MDRTSSGTPLENLPRHYLKYLIIVALAGFALASVFRNRGSEFWASSFTVRSFSSHFAPAMQWTGSGGVVFGCFA